jgi:predicted component of type VI protein secretion system
MPKLTINYACIADVIQVEPKEGDNQRKNRKVILHVDEEDFFDMLDNVNPKNIIKYLDMRGIAHREPANIVVKVKPDASGLKLRHSLKRVATELRNARENANGTD